MDNRTRNPCLSQTTLRFSLGPVAAQGPVPETQRDRKTNFKTYNTFADKDENPELPGSEWDFNFSEQNGTTKVSITIYNESLARMEKMIEMGAIKGCAAQFENLDELLETLSQK